MLESPPNTLNCDTKNFYFGGGNGDFSAMLDHQQQWLYLLISTYAGDVSQQGVCVAHMRWSDRDQPVGRVWKWQRGDWRSPGLGGAVTPVFPTAVDWHRADADSFWGPSIHWNWHLNQYVVLLNRSSDGNWSQEGVYVTFNGDLADPAHWSPPVKILGGLGADRWYPQVVGLDKERQETDKLAGRVARLFVRGRSVWEITFLRPGEANERMGSGLPLFIAADRFAKTAWKRTRAWKRIPTLLTISNDVRFRCNCNRWIG